MPRPITVAYQPLNLQELGNAARGLRSKPKRRGQPKADVLNHRGSIDAYRSCLGCNWPRDMAGLTSFLTNPKAMNDIKVSLIYLSDLPQYETEKLYELWLPTEPGVAKTNREFTIYHDVPIIDARTSEVDFDFHTTGFKYIHRPSQHAPRGADLDDPSHGSECPPTLVPCLNR